MPSTLLTLPIEIQLQIFQTLQIQDLHTLSQTCRTLNQLINNDELWKRLFQDRYNTIRFSSFSKSTKFAIELLKRDSNHRQWKRTTCINTNTPIQVSGIHDLILKYPRLLMLTDSGTIKEIALEKRKTKIQYEVPVVTMNGCTAFHLHEKYFLFGRFDGMLCLKSLGKTGHVASMVKFENGHTSAIVCLDYDDWNSVIYSGDETGRLLIWDVKNRLVLKEIEIDNSVGRWKFIKGFGKLVFTIDVNNVAYLVDALEDDVDIQRLPLEDNYETYDFDFESSTIIATDVNGFHLFQFGRHSSGSHHQYIVHLQESTSNATIDSIQNIAVENVRPGRSQNQRLAGQNGRHVAISLKSGNVLTFNIRSPQIINGQLQPLCIFHPEFDSLKLPNGINLISGLDVNSTVVLVSTYNGFSAVYDVLTGVFLRMVSSRIPKRYLPLTEAPFIAPTNVAKLGDETLGCFGITMTNDIVQYFQCGELRYKNGTSVVGNKINVNSPGGNGDMRRNKKYHKVIKSGIHDMLYENHQQLLEDKLVSKYNGDVEPEDELELAIALNESLNNNNVKNDGQEDLEVAMALSRLEFDESVDLRTWQNLEYNVESYCESDQEVAVVTDEEAEFQRQMEEALRRSMVE